MGVETVESKPAHRIARASDAWLSAPSYWIPSHLVESAWLEHGPFASWIVAAHRPRTIVELGTHNGFSYFAFSQAAEQLGLDTRLWAIDSWEGDDHAGFYDDEIYNIVVAANAPYVDRSTLLRGYFADEVGKFDDGSIDLLHIDGRHGYEDAKEDFETYLPKVSSRGIVLFHDIAERQEGFGVHRLWDEVSTRYPAFAFEHEHGLGVLLVGDEMTDEVRAFLEATRGSADQIRADYSRLGERVRDAWYQPRRAADNEAGRIELQHVADERANELAQIRASKAWRITAPLRKIRGSIG